MEIKLEQYRVFCTVAEENSFSAAAEKLFITQSAISQQIRTLESELGVTLFIRNRKGSKLTTQGEVLYTFAKKALNEIENAENLFLRMKSLDEGSLRIGAGDTLTKHYLLPFLERFHREYPGIKIEIVNRVTHETLNKLISGSVDVAFINLPVDVNTFPAVDFRSVGELHDIFIAGEHYRDIENKVFSISDVAELPLVMLEPKSNSRKTANDFFAKHGIQLRPEFELGSHDLLFDFAKRNLGIACVTEEFSPSLSPLGLFKLNTDFSLPARSIGVGTLKNVPPSPAVIKLLEMITQ